MGQSYPIYACSRANHAHYSSVHVKFCSTSKHTLSKQHWGKITSQVESVEHKEQYHTRFWEQITHFK